MPLAPASEPFYVLHIFVSVMSGRSFRPIRFP